MQEVEVKENEIQANIIQVTIPKKSIIFHFIKRCFDFLAAFIVSILLIIPMTIIAILIMCKDHGNPFYKQVRVGENGKPLYIYKFRSMRKGADDLENMLSKEQYEEYIKEYKLDDDPRLIGYKKAGDGDKCFGGMLRRMSLDELPQILFNICILGNMSVVGPRPILQQELKENYTPEEQQQLLSAKPGLTGYWQAYARNDAGYEDHKRQDMELFYIKNQSLLLDAKIIFKTIGTVLRKSGAK